MQDDGSEDREAKGNPKNLDVVELGVTEGERQVIE